MVPPPTFDDCPIVSYSRGERRNFYEERTEVAHKYPVGTRVCMRSETMRFPLGPLYVKEHCKPLFHNGPPQYILQVVMDGDNSKWIHTSERNIYAVDPQGYPIDEFEDEA